MAHQFVVMSMEGWVVGTVVGLQRAVDMVVAGLGVWFGGFFVDVWRWLWWWGADVVRGGLLVRDAGAGSRGECLLRTLL
jgi:hypothetical protein